MCLLPGSMFPYILIFWACNVYVTYFIFNPKIGTKRVGEKEFRGN